MNLCTKLCNQFQFQFRNHYDGYDVDVLRGSANDLDSDKRLQAVAVPNFGI